MLAFAAAAAAAASPPSWHDVELSAAERTDALCARYSVHTLLRIRIVTPTKRCPRWTRD
jgi:hypothetical protein